MKASKAILAALALAAATAGAATPAEIQQSLEAQARSQPGFAGFSAARGAQFFKATHGAEWSCASCHTADPRDPGRHAKTGKPIGPLAPQANAQRFSDPAKVEKWFARNCNDVLGRACTAQEKGDVLAFVLSGAR